MHTCTHYTARIVIIIAHELVSLVLQGREQYSLPIICDTLSAVNRNIN